MRCRRLREAALVVQRHYRAHRARRAALAMGDRERVRTV